MEPRGVQSPGLDFRPPRSSSGSSQASSTGGGHTANIENHKAGDPQNGHDHGTPVLKPGVSAPPRRVSRTSTQRSWEAVGGFGPRQRKEAAPGFIQDSDFIFPIKARKKTHPDTGTPTRACPRPQGVHWDLAQLGAAQRALTQDTCAPAQVAVGLLHSLSRAGRRLASQLREVCSGAAATVLSVKRVGGLSPSPGSCTWEPRPEKQPAAEPGV